METTEISTTQTRLDVTNASSLNVSIQTPYHIPFTSSETVVIAQKKAAYLNIEVALLVCLGTVILCTVYLIMNYHMCKRSLTSKTDHILLMISVLISGISFLLSFVVAIFCSLRMDNYDAIKIGIVFEFIILIISFAEKCIIFQICASENRHNLSDNRRKIEDKIYGFAKRLICTKVVFLILTLFIMIFSLAFANSESKNVISTFFIANLIVLYLLGGMTEIFSHLFFLGMIYEIGRWNYSTVRSIPNAIPLILRVQENRV